MYSLLSTYLKVNVVGYDYTGYGASMEYGTKPTEHQSYMDIETVYAYCLEKKIVADPSIELILYGQSVGSGPSCYLAKKRPIAGLVLHSPIMSGLRVLTDSRALACFDIFPNISRIRSINVPLFVIHGEVSHYNTLDLLFCQYTMPSQYFEGIQSEIIRVLFIVTTPIAFRVCSDISLYSIV